ncbi:MAG: universal stress protein [Beijerinckiaceae bacterium]|jgi:nucleotide-binding universal stress UspA family protein
MSVRSYKNLYTGLTLDPLLPSPALEFSFDLAAKCGAHLTVEVDATYDIPVDIMTYEATAISSELNDRFVQEAEKAAERVRFYAAESGVPCTVLSATETYAALVRRFAVTARTFDLAILDASQTALGGSNQYVEEALLQSGRPVAIVPEGLKQAKLERGLVAWDGSAQAARAVNEALPLLTSMISVEVVCVRPEEHLRDHIPGLEIELHLRRHGINATLTGLPTIGKDPVKTLIAHVQNVRPDLVVMGGYSHSWVRELVLGGMTRSMLTTCPSVLFLSH